jgi:hypothetical protein
MKKNNPTYKPMNYIIEKSKLPPSTLYGWREKLKRNPDWCPDRKQFDHNRRVFSLKQEDLIGNYIREFYVRPKKLLTLIHLRTIILKYYAQFNSESDNYHALINKLNIAKPFRPRPNFRCSFHFLKSFLKRKHLSYRFLREEKRPMINEAEVKIFFNRINEAIRLRIIKSCILNCDETCWTIVFLPKKTITETGANAV